MRHRHVAALLAACLIALGSPKAVHAAAEKIDCDKLHFSFAPAATADWSECYRYRETEATGDDSAGDNSVQFEHMLVDQGGHVVRIAEGHTGSSAYFPQRAGSGDREGV